MLPRRFGVRWLYTLMVIISLSLIETPLLAGIALVVHPASPLTTAHATYARRVWLGKESFYANGNMIQPLDVDPKSSIRAQFLKSVIGKTDSEYRQYWSRIVFTGKGTPPRNVGIDQDVVAWVAKEPLSIGLVELSHVTNQVRVVAKFE